jgi:hypothetical protein
MRAVKIMGRVQASARSWTTRPSGLITAFLESLTGRGARALRGAALVGRRGFPEERSEDGQRPVDPGAVHIEVGS